MEIDYAKLIRLIQSNQVWTPSPRIWIKKSENPGSKAEPIFQYFFLRVFVVYYVASLHPKTEHHK
jgi:hypothetical protein